VPYLHCQEEGNNKKRMKFRLFSSELQIDLTNVKTFLSEEHEATTHLKMSFVGGLYVSNCSQFLLGVQMEGNVASSQSI
jgi:hypothetical protein